MTANKSDPKQVYEALKEQLSKFNRTLKNLETRASKPNFSTDELASKSRKSGSFKGHRTGDRNARDEVDVKTLQDGQTKLERDLDILKEIQSQRNSRESKIQGAAVGRRRKSKRCIQFEKLQQDVADYKSLIGDILAEAEPVNPLREFGKKCLQEGIIPRNKEEKTRQELAAVSSRWNALSEEVFNTASSIDAFVSEVQMEYSKVNLWTNNSEEADALLMEYDAYADKPEKLGTTIKVVRLQLHENQTVLENFRKAKPRLRNMHDTALALMKSGRLEDTDAEEVERVINILVAKYESIDNRLNASRDRIYAEVNRLRKRMIKQRTSILRRFSSKRNSSFRRNRSLRKKRQIQQRKEMAARNLQASSTSMDLNASLGPVDIVMSANREYEDEKLRLQKEREAYQTFDASLKECEKTIYDLHIGSVWKSSALASNGRLENNIEEVMNFEAKLEKSRAEFHSEKEKFEKAKEEDLFDVTDGTILKKRVDNLESRWKKLWDDHVVKRHRLQKQRETVERFDLSLQKCENAVRELDSESLQNFSAAGSNGEELRKQLDDITRFESALRQARSQFQSEDKQFEKAKQEGLFSSTDRAILEKRVNNLQSLWDELWREHIDNKNRITRATLQHNHKSIVSITEDFDKIEERINAPEIYDDDRLYLEENILRQKRLIEDLDSYERPINQIHDTANSLLEKQLVDNQTFTTTKRKTEVLRERQQQLKNICTENEDRLATELLLLNQTPSDSRSEVEEEPVQISDDYAMLSRSLDDFLADEGFEDLESPKSFSETKMCDFEREVQSMNQWMCDTEKLVNSLHVRMDPNEVKERVQQIKKRCEEIDKKEAKIKHINLLGREITSESLNMTTTEAVEDKLQAVNKRWRDTNEMLSDYHDKDNEEAAGYESCCCFQMITRAFHACFYS